ncbi:hypothetical protein FRX31_034386 [Thalictrum thalictroides]|uniref:Transmembrane protein n=1 Tax=Thalictrum thalictroides TaxID=46969 RepID=A0A7J6UTY1_THATH|nr:hypothetical protein FRX31_034386 [Thalictrum thalictroides]
MGSSSRLQLSIFITILLLICFHNTATISVFADTDIQYRKLLTERSEPILHINSKRSERRLTGNCQPCENNNHNGHG